MDRQLLKKLVYSCHCQEELRRNLLEKRKREVSLDTFALKCSSPQAWNQVELVVRCHPYVASAVALSSEKRVSGNNCTEGATEEWFQACLFLKYPRLWSMRPARKTQQTSRGAFSAMVFLQSECRLSNGRCTSRGVSLGTPGRSGPLPLDVKLDISFQLATSTYSSSIL